MEKGKSLLVFSVALTMLLLPQLVTAQFPIDSATGKVKYVGIVNLQGISKEDIYKKSKSWIVSTLKSADNMTELDDANKERLVGTGTIIIDSLRMPYMFAKQYSKMVYLNFKIIILIKENKLKYSIENILLYYTDNLTQAVGKDEIVETGLENIKYPQNQSWTKNMQNKFKDNVYLTVNKSIINIITDYISYMKLKEDNNW